MINTFTIALSAICFFITVGLAYQTKTKWLALLAPLLAAGLLTLVMTVQQIQSMPLSGFPDKFQLISHITDGQTIHMWVATSDRDYPVTHVIPYSEESSKALQELTEQAKAGRPVVGQRSDEEVSGMEVVLGVVSNEVSENEGK